VSVDLIAIVPQVIQHQLASPFLFVPAIVVGWFARTRGQVVAGALAIGAVSIALSFLEPLPEGARRIYGLLPLVFISPLAWAFATAAFKTWLRRDDGKQAPAASTARKAVRALIGVVIGAPLGGAIGALLGTVAADINQISSFEGGAGYYVAFLFVLPGIVIGMLAGAVILWRWRS
jgi:hypothetical protein